MFTTGRLPADQRLEVWRDSIGTLFDIEPSRLSSPDSFNASLTSYLLNDSLMFSHCETGAQRFRRDALRSARDGLDYYLIQTHLRGSQELERCGRTRHCKPGDLLVIDLADIHLADTSDFSNLSLVVPRHLMAPLLLQPDSQQGRVLHADQGLTTLAVSHMMTLARVLPSLSQQQASGIIEPSLLLLASALNGSTDSVEGSASAVSHTLLTQAKLLIETRLQQPLAIDTLCRELKLSRAGLYRIFAPLGGVRGYIRERRLKRCAEYLLAPRYSHLPIYDIAYRWGFCSEAHFSRAFRSRYGISPSEARQAAKLPDPQPGGDAAEPPVGDRYYEQWLAGTLRH